LLAPFILPEVVSRAQAAHPYLDIEVDEVDAEEARDALRSGRAELSVGYDFTFGDGIKREVIDTTPAHVLLPATRSPPGTGSSCATWRGRS
jgi:DNA-binding transcriptional LysR family regulator